MTTAKVRSWHMTSPNKWLVKWNSRTFSGLTDFFCVFPGLEFKIFKFQDFPGFPGCMYEPWNGTVFVCRSSLIVVTKQIFNTIIWYLISNITWYWSDEFLDKCRNIYNQLKSQYENMKNISHSEIILNTTDTNSVWVPFRLKFLCTVVVLTLNCSMVFFRTEQVFLASNVAT